MAKRLVDTSSNDKLAFESDVQQCVKLSSDQKQTISSNVHIDGQLSINSDTSFLVGETNLKAYVNENGGKITKIIAGKNITVSPTSGIGEVTINSINGGGGGEGYGTWGYIDGNVEDQTDLIDVNYPLDNPIQSSEVVSGTTYKRFDVKDHTISTITLSDTTPVRIHFPSKPTANFCRDFIVKIKVTSATMPQVYFVKSDNDSEIGFEYTDEDWTTLEAGINYFTFTETERD